MHISTVDKFDNIEYLASGTAQQQRSYQVLCKSRIFDLLSKFDPLLVGTIPLNIDVPGSDLDIICQADDLEDFQRLVVSSFSACRMFSTTSVLIRAEPTILANFYLEDLAIELFAQRVPVKKQYGYRHMMKEYEILTNRGQEFREKVIALKASGIKTEPAFAQLLDIKGDPYEELLVYEDL
ncbi:DUF4269 domain-containing protein [Sphingobacterium oryzagri]|uniref:DUF4269 domain-containing protein n=1 Tax=Sphingobacterium oryzagri TaxID=3025669 RepID=A0ABY7WQ25_9SPHI|nr:DUF4269 domain-containing protein [Sphingobacterium sp. KACC 22765]WDF70827.1 DUF4269 domain-containing protein [Sphingobacterium sp. KACC 22765]